MIDTMPDTKIWQALNAAKARENEQDTKAPGKTKQTTWQDSDAAKAREDEEGTKAPAKTKNTTWQNL